MDNLVCITPEPTSPVQLPKPASESPAFSREVHDFLLELGLALQRYALYPGGHPSIDAAVAALVAGLDTLLRGREMLSVGVARRQLIVEGVATEDAHPVLRNVAERLHRHRVGVMTFGRGLTREELSSALLAVSRDPERSGETLGLMPAAQQVEWTHVRFHPLAYDHLQLADEGGEAEGAGGGGLAAQLWLGLARAALAKEELGGDAAPAQVAQAINERTGVRAYDQVIVGYMLQLTDELQGAEDVALEGVRTRLSQVVGRLEPGTLDRLLEMGGDLPQRARFLHGACRGLRPDAVLELVTAAARVEGQDISTSLLRLLRKLAAVAQTPVPAAAATADVQLREQVRDLLVGWSLSDPNPGAYTQALESLSRFAAEGADPASHHPAEALRLVQMSVEIGVVGVPLLAAVDGLLSEGALNALRAVLDDAAADNAAAQAIWARIESSDRVRALLTTDPIDIDTLDPVLRRLPLECVLSLLLDRLSESESRATRMALFRRLASFGLPLVPLAVERLKDPRWYVQRNMLALLHEIGAWPAGWSALPYMEHAEARVRREAVSVAVRIDAEREAAIARALADSDERVIRLGAAAAREHGVPAEAVPAALGRIVDGELSEEVQVALIRMLQPCVTDAVVEALVPLVVVPRTLLRRTRLAPIDAVMIAALTCLASANAGDPRVQQALELARAAHDPRVTRALRGAA